MTTKEATSSDNILYSFSDSSPFKRPQLSWEQVSIWFKRFLKAGSFFGITLILLYFVRYRFSPIDNLSSLGSVAALVALIAIMMAVSLFISWAAPAWIFNMVAADHGARSLLNWLHHPDKSPSSRRIKFLKVLILSLGLFAFPWLAIFAFLMKDFLGEDLHVWLVTGNGLIACALVAPFIFSRSNTINTDNLSGPETPSRPYWRKVLFRTLGTGGIGFFAAIPQIVVVSLTRVASLDNSSTASSTAWIFVAGIFLMSFTSALNMFIALDNLPDRRATWTAQAFVSFSSLLALMTFMNVYGGLVDGVMTAASIRLPRTQISLSADGCKTLELYAMRSTIQPALQSVFTKKEGDSCILSAVTVVSRLGDWWWIGCPSRSTKGDVNANKGDHKGISISARHVQGWTSIATTAKTDPRIEQVCSNIE